MRNSYLSHLDHPIQRILPSSPDETVALLQQYDRLGIDSRAISNWMRADSSSAATWLSQQPASEKRDQYTSSLLNILLYPHIGSFAGQLAIANNADFEGSLAWAEFIGQDELKKQTSEQVIAGWLEHHPEEAAAYFEPPYRDPTSREIFRKLKQESSE